MKKSIALILTLFGLTGFSDLPESSSLIDVESRSTDWQVEMVGSSLIKAYYPKAEVELLINVANILPDSPQCMSNKRIKDIKMTIQIRKIAQAGDRDWAKSFEKMRINFSGDGGGERRVYGSNLIKNNLKVAAGTNVNVGTLQFLAPVVCEKFLNSTIRITSISAGGRGLPALTFSIQKAKK